MVSEKGVGTKRAGNRAYHKHALTQSIELIWTSVQCRATHCRPLRTASHLSVSIVVNVQEKLELTSTGIPAASHVLSLLNSQKNKRVIAELCDDSKPLELYGFRDWQVIEVSIKSSFLFANHNCNKGGILIDKNPSAASWRGSSWEVRIDRESEHEKEEKSDGEDASPSKTERNERRQRNSNLL